VIINDTRPKPGDIVMVRGNNPLDVWAVPASQRSGVVMPESLGLVISAAHVDIHRFYSYVLWSCPTICGWVQDGFLRKV